MSIKHGTFPCGRLWWVLDTNPKPNGTQSMIVKAQKYLRMNVKILTIGAPWRRKVENLEELQHAVKMAGARR